MKAGVFSLIIILCLTSQCLQAQNSISNTFPTSKSAKGYSESITFNPDKWYLDASGGFFLRNNSSSWSAQLGAGYRLSPTAALGIGSANWGRISLYGRSAMGIGVQYRQILWDNFIAKIEGGYVLKSQLKNDSLERRIEYFAKSSTPLYYKFDLNWRIRHFLTLGISAYQTGNLKFLSYFPDTSTILDTWRINAFTVQLGIALDTRDADN
jgi:hypothetical protein